MSVNDIFQHQSGVAANVSVDVRALSIGDLSSATPLVLSIDPKTLITEKQVRIIV